MGGAEVYVSWPPKVKEFRVRLPLLTAPWGPCKGARHWCGFRIGPPFTSRPRTCRYIQRSPPYGSHPCGLVAPLRNLLATEVHVVAPRLAVGPSARSAPWGTYQRKLNAPPG